MVDAIHQINLSPARGGGEVYTLAFSRALRALGVPTVLYALPEADWTASLPEWLPVRPVRDGRALLAALPARRSLIVTHTALFPGCSTALAQRHRLTGFAHMPLYDRSVAGFADYERVFAVSQHVINSLHAQGFARVHDEPLYGIAEFDRGQDEAGTIRRRRLIQPDRRKMRDRLLAWLEGCWRATFGGEAFVKRPGLTLGIVSLLSPIKQFPELFRHLVPHLAAYPQVNLEIFGGGGFGQVRTLQRVLAPLGERARFWGDQPDPRILYRQLDWLLTGLPEKEALGLNVIEAQALGTPVLAVRAPPFTETVLDGLTGRFYQDPRRDGGADFARLLAEILTTPRPDPRQAQEHLARFALPAFTARVARALRALEDHPSPACGHPTVVKPSGAAATAKASPPASPPPAVSLC